MQRSFARKVQDHPIVVVWAMVWIVVAILNFGAGMKTGGFALAMAFVSIAMLGAYASSEWESATGGRRVGLGVLIVLQLILGQWAGWQTLGINLSQGATGLDTAADTHNSASDQLKKAKAEREALGTPRTIAAIEADEHLECESGVGPKCTGLRKELADAQRAADLDKDIPELVAQLGNAPQLSDSNAPYSVARAFGSAIGSIVSGKKVEASRDDVIFWFEIFVTIVLEFVGTCGPWLFRIGEKWADPEPVRVAAADGWDFGPARLTHQNLIQGEIPRSAPHAPRTETGPMGHADDFVPRGRAAQGSPAGSFPASAGADGLHRPQQTPASIPSEQHQHGAPITVNLYGPTGAPAAAAVQVPTPLVPIEDATDSNVRALRQVVRQPMTPAIEQSVRDAPQIPVDRTNLQNLLDSLIVFMAAELVAQTGAWTEASQVYGRYQEYAKDRACAPEAFHTLFPAATHVQLSELGGVKHYANVALRRRALAKEAS